MAANVQLFLDPLDAPSQVSGIQKPEKKLIVWENCIQNEFCIPSHAAVVLSVLPSGDKEQQS